MKPSAAMMMLAILAGAANAAAVTPLEKVLMLLETMMAKGLAEKQNEEAQYRAYSQYCNMTIAEKNKAIAEASAQIEMARANSEKLQTQIAQLDNDILTRTTQISGWTNDKDTSTAMRQNETKIYTAMHTDVDESLRALKDATATVRAQKTSLAQVSEAVRVTQGLLTNAAITAHAPDADMQEIDNFLQHHAAVLSETGTNESVFATTTGAPFGVKITAYKFQSNRIIEILQNLRDDFNKQRNDLEANEQQARASYSMMQTDLANQIKFAQDESKDRAETRGRAARDLAEAQTNLAQATTTNSSEADFLAEVSEVCEDKTVAFNVRNALRNQELEALGNVTEILRTNVQANADRHFEKLLQLQNERVSALAHLRSNPQRPMVEKAQQYLREKGQALHLPALLALADHASAEPFEKILRMLQDLVDKLTTEKNAEQSHNDWCVEQLDSQTSQADHIALLASEVQQWTMDSEKLQSEIDMDNTSLIELREEVANTSARRAQEHEDNLIALTDAQQAQAALAQATDLLNDFYAKANASQSLLQITKSQRHRASASLKAFLAEAPAIFDKAYVGMQDVAHSQILAFLDVIRSDFARLEANAKKTEAGGESQFQQFIAAANASAAQLTSEIGLKQTDIAKKKVMIDQAQSEHDAEQRAEALSNAYYKTVRDACKHDDISADQRIKTRKVELQALEEALIMMSQSSTQIELNNIR